MAVITLVFALALAYGLYRYLMREKQMSCIAFAVGESTPGQVDIRNAGPDAMAGDLRNWDAIDQASDERFPASNPQAHHRFT